jgi:hypothetical protein
MFARHSVTIIIMMITIILIPWREGRSAMGNVTNTVAASHLTASSTTAASAAESAAQRKETKYAEISKTHLFLPLAFEPMGPINLAGQEFISELGHRISASTENPRETCSSIQRLSDTIQRFNAICFAYSSEHESDTDNYPKCI